MIMSMSKVICVTNRHLVTGDFLEQIEGVLQKGVKALILREKDLEEKEYEILAGKVKLLCEEYHTPLYLHTYIEAAKKIGIPRMHLSYEAFCKMKQEEKDFFEILGVSIHSVEEAKEAQRRGASYLIAGHIFATDCKKGVQPRGTAFLEGVCKAVRIPVYGIGGITKENISECIKVGAKGVCIMSGFMRGI